MSEPCEIPIRFAAADGKRRVVVLVGSHHEDVSVFLDALLDGLQEEGRREIPLVEKLLEALAIANCQYGKPTPARIGRRAGGGRLTKGS